jgi:hypothetical protein
MDPPGLHDAPSKEGPWKGPKGPEGPLVHML